jgi:hypothetical protein
MCQYRSGVATWINDVLTVYTLPGEDSHGTIRGQLGIADGVGCDRQAPFEYVPTAGLHDWDSYVLRWDNGRPAWATVEVEDQICRHMDRVVRADDLSAWEGYLYLGSLASIPEGVTATARQILLKSG